MGTETVRDIARELLGKGHPKDKVLNLLMREYGFDSITANKILSDTVSKPVQEVDSKSRISEKLSKATNLGAKTITTKLDDIFKIFMDVDKIPIPKFKEMLMRDYGYHDANAEKFIGDMARIGVLKVTYPRNPFAAIFSKGFVQKGDKNG